MFPEFKSARLIKKKQGCIFCTNSPPPGGGEIQGFGEENKGGFHALLTRIAFFVEFSSLFTLRSRIFFPLMEQNGFPYFSLEEMGKDFLPYFPIREDFSSLGKNILPLRRNGEGFSSPFPQKGRDFFLP